MRQMFGVIAPRYDFITRAFSFGMDRRWKRAGVARGGHARAASCPGPGLRHRRFFETGGRNVGLSAVTIAADLTHGMLRLARSGGVDAAVCADAMALPFPDRSFDCVFIGYGLRNFPRLDPAIAEIERITRPGGLLVSLDFFLPRKSDSAPALSGLPIPERGFLGHMYYTDARGFTRTSLIPSAALFRSTIFTALLRRSGYRKVDARGFLCGGIALHWAAKK